MTLLESVAAELAAAMGDGLAAPGALGLAGVAFVASTTAKPVVCPAGAEAVAEGETEVGEVGETAAKPLDSVGDVTLDGATTVAVALSGAVALPPSKPSMPIQATLEEKNEHISSSQTPSFFIRSAYFKETAPTNPACFWVIRHDLAYSSQPGYRLDRCRLQVCRQHSPLKRKISISKASDTK